MNDFSIWRTSTEEEEEEEEDRWEGQDGKVEGQVKGRQLTDTFKEKLLQKGQTLTVR